MSTRHKILLLDDEQDLLDLYREILAMMPSKPEIFTANNGARALALLESEPFTVLVCDLKMPKMDGLQVLSVVRRKFPDVRTVVLTSVSDEQFRSRVYALGVDLFWQKPGSEREIKMFLECLESLLGREGQAGFRGVQSKSLVDILQLECISQNSVVLKITNGPRVGTIWITDGELIDAATDDLTGEAAFYHILSWKAGGFETLPAEPDRPRTIYNSYQALLLESAQAMDEAQGAAEIEGEVAGSPPIGSPVSAISRIPGVEFVLTFGSGPEKQFDSWGLENPGPLTDWARSSLQHFRALADRLRAGTVHQFEGLGPQRHMVIACGPEKELAVGWRHTLSATEVRESMKKVLNQWAS